MTAARHRRNAVRGTNGTIRMLLGALLAGGALVVAACSSSDDNSAATAASGAGSTQKAASDGGSPNWCGSKKISLGIMDGGGLNGWSKESLNQVMLAVK